MRIVLWLACAITVAYWVVWYAGDRAWLASLHTPEYYAFENAFPVADAWLAFSCAAAAVTLGRRSGTFWLIAAGSASVYLSAMDVLFDLEHGVYATGGGAAAAEIAINVATLVLGVWLLRAGWRALTGSASR